MLDDICRRAAEKQKGNTTERLAINMAPLRGLGLCRTTPILDWTTSLENTLQKMPSE
jgi:hypothetical protein